VFIYRQMRPYRKWSCPSIDIAQAEAEIWNDFRADAIDVGTAVKHLTEARDGGTMLSARSSELLSIENEAERLVFALEMKSVQYQQQTTITTMEVLKKESDDVDSISMLVVGTEAGDVLILPHDPNNSSYQCRIRLPSAPVMMVVSGVFDVEWRVAVACRDGKVYVIKNGDVRGTAVLSGTVIDLGSQAVAMTSQDKMLWVATMDRVSRYRY
jgi:Bardet-Biedl syndrome 1 protein